MKPAPALTAIGLVVAACLLPHAKAQVFVGQQADGTMVLSDVRSASTPELWIAGKPAEIAVPGAPKAAATVPAGKLHVPRLPDHYLPMFQAAARDHGVSASLIAAVAAAESAFDPKATSPKGARGLMQLMPDTARRFNVSDRLSPEQSVRGGAAYLRWLSDHFDNDLDRVLAAYNAGERVVERVGGVPPYPETQAYVPRVQAYLRHFNLALGATVVAR